MIIGRKPELEKLQRIYESERGEFVIVYGRRRVGKTFLVRKAFGGSFDFYCTGLFKKPKKRQLENFANALAEYSGRDCDVPKDWYAAFRMLKEYLKSLGDRRKLVFLDELPWMATAKSDFVGALESFWNGWGSTDDNLKLIVCGSASSWFADNVFSNKGGLFNRDTDRIYLRPFTLHETEEYLQSQGVVLSRYEMTECYMIMGGIPYYLSKIDRSLSLPQNVDRMFFQPKALLFDEFTHLYDALFNKSEDYIKIVTALAGKRSGLTQTEILKATGIPQGGNFSKMLENLIFSDLVEKMVSYGEEKKEDRYLLCDFYTQFYFSYIRDNETKDAAYWTNRLDDSGHDAWRGLTFERVCLWHLPEIKKKLGISGVATETYALNRRGDGEKRGAQIDLIIDRKDQVVNLCEMKFVSEREQREACLPMPSGNKLGEAKFSKNEFGIDGRYVGDLENKVAVYKEFIDKRANVGSRVAEKTTVGSRPSQAKAVHLTMVTTFGLKPSKHNTIVQSQVTLDDLFEKR